MINERLENKFKVVIAPGPGEIKDASSINALCVLDNGKALDISQLAALIKDSSFVVANDTGTSTYDSSLRIKRNCFIWISYNSF
jgi:ADP-heptose:LPS heptosyltransferase